MVSKKKRPEKSEEPGGGDTFQAWVDNDESMDACFRDAMKRRGIKQEALDSCPEVILAAARDHARVISMMTAIDDLSFLGGAALSSFKLSKEVATDPGAKEKSAMVVAGLFSTLQDFTARMKARYPSFEETMGQVTKITGQEDLVKKADGTVADMKEWLAESGVIVREGGESDEVV